MNHPHVPTPTGWALLAMVLLVSLFIVSGPPATSRSDGDDRVPRTEQLKAAQLLADQLARGQIDQHEYEELSAQLDSIPTQRDRRSAHRPRHSRRGR